MIPSQSKPALAAILHVKGVSSNFSEMHWHVGSALGAIDMEMNRDEGIDDFIFKETEGPTREAPRRMGLSTQPGGG